jgi:hypothetical protein
MPEITLRHEIDTDEETYWSKVFFDDTFNKHLFEGELKFPSWKVIESKVDDDKVTRVIQVDPPVADLPGPMKKVIGDRISYTETGTFDKKSKRYTFKVTPSTLAEKTKVSGELSVERISDKKICRVAKISVEVKVFVVGGMIEDKLISDLRASYEKGAAVSNKFIRDNGL